MRLNMFLHPLLIRFILVVFLVFIIAPAAITQQKQSPPAKLNIAVLEFESRGGVSKEDAASLSDAFQGQIIETDEFIVVDRKQIKKILDEQGFQQSEACSEVQCIVEVGKILRVEKMFSGTIGKLGAIYTAYIQLIDVATAQIQKQKSRQHSGDIEDLLTDIIPELAAEMVKELTGKDIEVTTSTSGGSSSWIWYTLGGVAVAGGVAALVLSKKSDENKPQIEPLPESPSFP